MKRWVSRLLFRDSSGLEVSPSVASAPVPPVVPVPASPQGLGLPHAAELGVAFFASLLALPGDAAAASPEDEAHWLAAFDASLVADLARGDLLPRAAGVVPQLLSSLRDEAQSADALAQRVARDPNLVAEVTRLANTAALRGNTPVLDLADAVRRIGTAGVRQAIAKVVMRPIFAAQAGERSTRAATALWAHAQAQADLSRALASARGLDPFTAYLGGLLFDVGWTAGLRALDRVAGPQSARQRPSPAFVLAFGRRRERLFAQVVGTWGLGASLQAAADAVSMAGNAENAANPLARLLFEGHQLAALKGLVATGAWPDDAARVASWPVGVQAVYAAQGESA